MKIQFNTLHEVVWFLQGLRLLPLDWDLDEHGGDIQCGLTPYTLARGDHYFVTASGCKRRGYFTPEEMAQRLLTPCNGLTYAHFKRGCEGDLSRIFGSSEESRFVTESQKRHHLQVLAANRRLHREEERDDYRLFASDHREFLKEYKKAYVQDHKERFDEVRKQYSEDNKDKIKEYHKIYYQENKEVFREKSSAYRLEHAEDLKKYRDNHKDSRRKNSRKWYDENKELCIERSRVRRNQLWTNGEETLKWSTLSHRGRKQDLINQGWKPIE